VAVTIRINSILFLYSGLPYRPYSLFIRFVLFLMVCVLENFVVLISKKCTYFESASLFCLILSYSSIKVRNHIATI